MVLVTLVQHLYIGFCLLLPNTDSVAYQSDRLKQLQLSPYPGEFRIKDDEEEWVQVNALRDRFGAIYWYRRINTPVCQTGECKLVDVGLYWHCNGDFLGIEVYGEHLTKTDHSIFSQDDYDKLLSVLDNDWSLLREYEFDELVEPVEVPFTEPEQRPDAISGATNKLIASESVSDAVYTTYTLWHLVHVGEKEQLEQLSIDLLNRHEEFLNSLLQHQNVMYRRFLLDAMALGKLNATDALHDLVVDGLQSADRIEKDYALRALPKSNANDPAFQAKVARVYAGMPINEKLRLLSALQNVHAVSDGFYRTLAADLRANHEWLSVKILTLLQHANHHTGEVVDAARRLSESENALVKKTASEFLQQLEQK